MTRSGQLLVIEPVSVNNSRFDGRIIGKKLWGRPTNETWADLEWSKAWIDNGPSPAGNPGPYLKVPYPPEDTVHRIYPRKPRGIKRRAIRRVDAKQAKDISTEEWLSAGYSIGNTVIFPGMVPDGYVPPDWCWMYWLEEET